jgi:hypothetical protein
MKKKKNGKMEWGNLEFFSRTTGPVLTKLDTTESSLGEGIKVCSYEGERPSPKGDNSERVKVH